MDGGRPELNDANLRHRLSQITQSENVAEHPRLLDELRAEVLHTIRLAPSHLALDLPLNRYNCFEYALGLAGDERLRRIAGSFSRCTYCSTEFLAYLEVHRLLLPATSHSSGAIVAYRAPDEYTHAGRLYEEFVVSKWGCGQLWCHGIWEVPESYGESFKLLRAADPEELSDAFVEFAREREGGTAVDELLAAP